MIEFKEKIEEFARTEIRKYYDEDAIHEGDADDMHVGIKIGITFGAALILKFAEENSASIGGIYFTQKTIGIGGGKVVPIEKLKSYIEGKK